MLTGYGGGAFDGLANVTSYQWANEHAGYLAGVAAATTTETGTVGFLGALNTWRPGGVPGRLRGRASQSIDPDVRSSPPT